MNTAIERLRASKQEADPQDRTEGKQAGRNWAEQKAEHAELRRVSEIPDGGFYFANLRAAIDLEHDLTNEEIVSTCSAMMPNRETNTSKASSRERRNSLPRFAISFDRKLGIIICGGGWRAIGHRGETMDSNIKEKLDGAIKILESRLAFASVRTWGETEKRIREAIAILKEARD